MIKYLVGLPPLYNGNTLEKLDNLCKKYKDIIEYWYVSPPFNPNFASRGHVYCSGTDKEINELKDEINVIKQNNLKIQLALNTTNIDPKMAVDAYLRFEDLYGKVDSVVTMDDLIDYILPYNNNLCYSYNNNVIKDNVSKCNTIVLGNRNIRNIKLMYDLKNKYNIKIELLLNNGCHFYCNQKCTKDCERLYNKRKEDVGFIRSISESSLFPYELKLYPNGLIDLYKISCRNSTFEYIDTVLYNYMDMSMNMNLIDDFYYYNRLVYLVKDVKNFKPFISDVLNEKRKIWEEVLKDLENLNLVEKEKV